MGNVQRVWECSHFVPEIGTIYLNRNGSEFLCMAVRETGAVMERVSDGWTLTAHGLLMYADGTIEWDYSTGGRWTR